MQGKDLKNQTLIKLSGSLFVFLIVLLSSACDNNRVYDKYINFPSSGWNKDSIATFNFNIDNTDIRYNMYVNIRNTSDYPNSNLWLFIDIIPPTGKAERDTVECFLADSRGKWYGSGWGSIHQLKLPFKGNVEFKETGDYQFRITQGMRADILKGINDIGIRVETVKEQ